LFSGEIHRFSPFPSTGKGLDVVVPGCPHLGATLWHAGGKDLEPPFGISLSVVVFLVYQWKISFQMGKSWEKWIQIGTPTYFLKSFSAILQRKL